METVRERKIHQKKRELSPHPEEKANCIFH